MKYVPAAGD